MSLSLKPFTIDSTNKQLDSKQKKFHTNVNRALERFDTVTEWADYIASLGALLKALQSWSPKFQNVKYYVPIPYQVSRRLTSSLSPNLPAGVHQKTLEVYMYIFENIGIEMLAAESNIWVPGILPLMSFASMSVKSHLIDLYDTYLVQLPSSTLKMLIKPLLASLFPGIDDESSEFLPLTIKLIETLKENVSDDSLFWQTCFLIMATNKDRRLGGLVWLTKKFPSLNAVPHLVKEKNELIIKSTGNSNIDKAIEKKKLKEQTLSTLLPAAKDLVTPEPGLLVRCFIRCLDDDNDLLIKRNILDLLLQRLHLNSPLLELLVSEEDRKLLIIKCCKTTLNKDMSLNRRIWNWLLGPTTTAQAGAQTKEGNTEPSTGESGSSNEYFVKYGLQPLLSGLKDLLNTPEGLIVAFRICITFLDKWELGSLLIPEMFIPLLRAAESFSDNTQVLKTANTFFDTVETNIIWGKIFIYIIETKNFNFLKFILSNFHIANDEEIIIRHLPLIVLATLSFVNSEKDSDIPKAEIYSLLSQMLEFIPERALLLLSYSNIEFNKNTTPKECLDKISTFYKSVSDPEYVQEEGATIAQILPFSSETLTYLLVSNLYTILLRNLETHEYINESAKIYVTIFETIPEHKNEDEKASSDSKTANWSNTELIDIIFGVAKTVLSQDDSNQILGIVDLYSNYLGSRMDLIESVKLLNLIIITLWGYMVEPHKQLIAIKCLKSFEKTVPKIYIASALSSAFVKETDVQERINVLDLLWNQLDTHNELIERPLELILDELFDRQNPSYLPVSKWVLSILNSGSSNRLYQFLTNNLLSFEFLNRYNLTEFDDLEMFTYRIRMLTIVLKSNKSLIVKNFGAELTTVGSVESWKNEDVSTYKNLVLVIILKFLQIKNNVDTKSIRGSLILLDCLLDGSESNFKDIVILLLQMSSKYISEGGLDSELIAVSLLDIVSKVLRLSHDNDIKLDIFDDNSTHLKYIDFLVTSLSSMNTPLIITSYVKILSESIVYFGGSIFLVILPLTASIVQCIQRLFVKEKNKGGYYQPIALLLGGLEDLLEVAHRYLSVEERENYFSSGSQKGDFLQSVVSNVFYSDNTDDSIKSQGERDVILQSFKQVTLCCSEIWSWSHSISNTQNEGAEKDLTYYNSSKFKFRAKKLLEKMFMLEPLEILENIINVGSDDVLNLIHVLDGNKPSLTLPYIFHSVVVRYDRHSAIKFSFNNNRNVTGKSIKFEPSMVNKLSGNKIMEFLIQYATSLENSAIEEFYTDFIIFFKEVSTNYNLFKIISLEVISFVGIIGQKLSMSQMGEQKRYRKELSDLFVKYIPNVLFDIPVSDGELNKTFLCMEGVVHNTPALVNDSIGGDKFNTIISTIVTQCLSSKLKTKGNNEVAPSVLSLALEVAKVGSKVKNWKVLIAEIFNEDKRFCIFGTNPKWENIIFEWSQYPENKSKLLNDLLLVTGSKKMGMTPSLITFNSWNNSEIDARCQNLLRISYLLLVSPVDSYLLDFQSLISCVCQYLVANENSIKSKCWILLRTLLLKFDVSHFNEYWSMISYSLQMNLQQFYESLQIQEEIDSNSVLQICKALDLLLALNYEGFSATNEWIFIIDTINCVHRTVPFVSLVDEIAELKPFEINRTDDIEILTAGQLRLPLLYNVHHIEQYMQLRNFFHNLSYEHYEGVYSMKLLDMDACTTDIMKDIFY